MPPLFVPARRRRWPVRVKGLMVKASVGRPTLTIVPSIASRRMYGSSLVTALAVLMMRFIELAAALKFFSNVDLARGWQILPREVFLMIWAFLFVALALFLFGSMGYRGVPVEGVSKARNGSALASMAFAFYCLFGAMGFTLDPVMTAFEPPYRLRPIDEHTIVKDDHDGALSLAAREDKLVLVNFTGFT